MFFYLLSYYKFTAFTHVIHSSLILTPQTDVCTISKSVPLVCFQTQPVLLLQSAGINGPFEMLMCLCYTCTCPILLKSVKSIQCLVLWCLMNQHYSHLSQQRDSRLQFIQYKLINKREKLWKVQNRIMWIFYSAIKCPSYYGRIPLPTLIKYSGYLNNRYLWECVHIHSASFKSIILIQLREVTHL